MMVHSNPDLASSVGAGQTVLNVENPGMTHSPPVQMHNDLPIPQQQQSPPFPSPSRPAVERTSTSSSSNLKRAAEEAGNMTVAVDIPLLRHSSYSFDPWSPRKKKYEDACPGCAKIAKARAIAAAVAAAAGDGAVVDQEPVKSTTPTPREGTKAQLEDPATSGAMTSLQTLEDGASDTAPEELQQLAHNGSVLAIAVSDKHIFVGTSKGEIAIWSLGTYQPVRTIQAHRRSVLSLLLTEDQKYLFSTASEPIINVWCPKTFTRLYEIYTTHDVGDVFSVAYSAQRDMVFVGTQTQEIQWVSLSDERRKTTTESPQHPYNRHHRFFDSSAVGGTSTPRRVEDHYALIPQAQEVIEIHHAAKYDFAHFGWIYCLQVAKGPTVQVGADEEVLVSAGGDGTIKLWRLKDEGPEYDVNNEITGDIEELMILGEDNAESVMSLAIDGSFLYAGKLKGVIELWDLDTKQLLRVIKAHDGNVNTLGMKFGLLWSAAAGGSASKHSTVHYGRDANGVSGNVSQKYQCLSRWKAHDAKIISSALATFQNDQLFLTGANDNQVRVWRVNGMPQQGQEDVSVPMMISSLREFVAYKTVSSRPEFIEDCRKGATFLGSLFKRLGAQVEMLSSKEPNNPVVYAKFSGKLEPAEKRKRILFYGHYDVVPAPTKGGNWNSDPFKLTGKDGYLYGRGVSDNKGPIIAALYAVADLLQAKSLDSDIVFLIEGEEESGSQGFEDIVRQNKQLIGNIDYVLLANSYWLDDEIPCLTYGLRGVLHATVCIDSIQSDIHSGVDGSDEIAEPLSELTTLCSKLKGKRNHINIPGFYDGVPDVTEEEEQQYDEIASIVKRRDPSKPLDMIKREWMAKWRKPNLTLHGYNVSAPEGSLISSHASANISIRLVPGQDIDVIAKSLKTFLEQEYEGLHPEQQLVLSVNIKNKAEPWLGVPGNYLFKTLEEAVMAAWGGAKGEEGGRGDGDDKALPTRSRRPIYIREGGSIPPIRFLEKEFNAPAANLPCGQSSDGGHLPNERLRVENLQKSREIFMRTFERL
ncbi:hypothetical protein V8F20_001361 [Naviculisporaceae sp. PSN 640]